MKTKLLTIFLLAILSGCSEKPISGKFLYDEHICEDDDAIYYIDKNILSTETTQVVKSIKIHKDYSSNPVINNAHSKKILKKNYEEMIVPEIGFHLLTYNRLTVTEYELDCIKQEFMYKKINTYFPKRNKKIRDQRSNCQMVFPIGNEKNIIDFDRTINHKLKYKDKKIKFSGISEISCKAKIFDNVCFIKEMKRVKFNKVSNKDKENYNKKINFWNALRDKKCTEPYKPSIFQLESESW